MIKFQSLPRQKRQAIRDEVLRLYAETDLSYGEIAEENGVQVRTVEYIVGNFASELPEIPTMRKKKKDASEEDYDKLRAEVTRLRKELRQEKMRSEALETMIDVAEEMFNIPVRKKLVPNSETPVRTALRHLHGVGAVRLFGKSKQAYYKHDSDAYMRRVAMEEMAVRYIEEVREAMHTAVPFYNNERTHRSFSMLPCRRSGRFKRGWTSYRERAIDNLDMETLPT